MSLTNTNFTNNTASMEAAMYVEHTYLNLNIQYNVATFVSTK